MRGKVGSSLPVLIALCIGFWVAGCATEQADRVTRQDPTSPDLAERAQLNTCRYAVDDECDEPKICASGTDSWDCRREGVLGPNDCFWAYDGECDGPALCPNNSDSWDCRREGAQPGPESCPYSNDGECDEPQGLGYCLAGTDTMDCDGSSQLARNSCEWPYDGECDEPQGTDLCALGTDSADCRGDYGGTFFGEDNRVSVDASSYPWTAIGKVIFESGGYCTASVVGRQTLLTVASCLFIEEDGNRLDRPIEFLGRFDGYAWATSARVTGYFLPPRFGYERYMNSSDIDGLDWAFLVVDRDIGTEVGTIEVMPLTIDDLHAAIDGNWYSVMQAGFSSDSDTWLTAHLGCPIVEVFDDDTFFHECDTLNGDGGSPLFVERDGRYWIIGVESAAYPNTVSPYPWINMAVDARAFYQEYLRQVPPDER